MFKKMFFIEKPEKIHLEKFNLGKNKKIFDLNIQKK